MRSALGCCLRAGSGKVPEPSLDHPPFLEVILFFLVHGQKSPRKWLGWQSLQADLEGHFAAFAGGRVLGAYWGGAGKGLLHLCHLRPASSKGACCGCTCF